LTRPEIIEVVAAALAKTGGDRDLGLLEIDFDLRISEDGCGYVVVGIHQPPESQGHFLIALTRAREVVSWPWCCVDSLKVRLGPPPVSTCTLSTAPAPPGLKQPEI
jgi:hypothetical protein